LNGPVFIDFCRRLLADTPGPVLLVLDGPPVHRSKAVKQFAGSTGGRLRPCFLPGYAPELNPGEWGWKQVKHDRIGRAGVTGPGDLKAKALSALHRLQSFHIWCGASSGTRTCATSPPDQSTYIHSSW
jgi:transposase